MFSVRMNDLAVEAMAVPSASPMEPPGGLAAGLRERAARGIVHRGQVVTWADSTGDVGDVPSSFPDLTGWECGDSSLHLEDFVPVQIDIIDGQPSIGEYDQRLLLLHGIALARLFGRLVHDLDPPAQVCCIISANETNATFRFHRIRVGESWNTPNLDDYRHEKIIVVDIEPRGEL
ncbi:hypothetical protein ACFYUD_03345 [Nocardia tengchongensis]|uniref:hypothetical protein n=1 Tax=Nocardia tengchongensis TaxID=2055889 RepID=UPI003694FF20